MKTYVVSIHEVLLMSSHIMVCFFFLKKLEKYQYFGVEKNVLPSRGKTFFQPKNTGIFLQTVFE